MTTQYVHRSVGLFLVFGQNRSRSAHDSDSGAVSPTASEPNPPDIGNVKTPVTRSTLCTFCFLPSQSRIQISHPCSLISFPLCSKSPRSTYTGVDGSPVGTRGRAGLAGYCQPSAFARMRDWVLCHSQDISELSATGCLCAVLLESDWIISIVITENRSVIFISVLVLRPSAPFLRKDVNRTDNDLFWMGR